jgi:20S proteasome alpha/beta subunit
LTKSPKRNYILKTLKTLKIKLSERPSPMTVCIAAVCESEQKIVLAADRMFTFPYPTNLEFETEEKKIEELSPNCVALISGNSGYAEEILENSRKKIGGNQSPEINQVIKTVKEVYAALRMIKIDETIISSALATDYAKFLQKGGTLPAYLQVQGQIYQQLFLLSQQYNLGVDIIVAGIDAAGAHISVVHHPGTVISLNKLGYGAIGSGAIHATIYLSSQGQTGGKSLLETLHNIYTAKKVSEVAPGVGQETDIAIVESGRLFRCERPIVEELQKIFSEVTARPSPSYKKLEEIYNEQCK